MKYIKIPIYKLLTGLLYLLGSPIFSSTGCNLKTPFRAKFFMTMSVATLSLGVTSMYLCKNNSHMRLIIFQDITVFTINVLFLSDFIYSSKAYKPLIDIMRFSTVENFKYIDKNEKDKIIDKADTISWLIIRYMVLGMVSYWGIICVVPLVLILRHLIYNEEIDLSDIIMPFPSFKLLRIDSNLKNYTINFVTQVIIYAVSLFIISVWMLLQSCTLVHISYDLKLLSDIFNNMDYYIEKINVHGEYKIDLSFSENVKYNKKLKIFLKNIHLHHLQIIRNMKQVNKSLNFTLLVFNQLVCFHFSLLLYSMFQNNEFSGKGRYILAYCSSTNCYGISCVIGQLLFNKSEDLWKSISSSSWQNKPIWFKNSIKMLLIGTQKPLKLEPIGLYVLDLKFLLKVLQMSYSYCNIMLQLNSKKVKK
ncbi:uncharacterized protein LOC142317524 [Lycorma delicatula]|uniref:uncharacterized protein LOC142317524 n=1 Tax=Lycorma delicatula TaxID=130591 RepID=UPI003F51AACC